MCAGDSVLPVEETASPTHAVPIGKMTRNDSRVLFMGTLLQPDGTRVIVLQRIYDNFDRALYYNIGKESELPVKVLISAHSFTVVGLEDNGNRLLIRFD